MPGPIRTRQSCDRCHAQKLKCPKQAGSAVCARCERAGAVCTFSPAGGTRLNHQDGAYAVARVQDGLGAGYPSIGPCDGLEGGIAGLDWSFLNPGLLAADPVPRNMVGSVEAQEHQSQLDATKGPAMDFSFTSPPQTEGSSSDKPPIPSELRSLCVKQLSKVVLDLDTVWTAILPRQSLHIPFDENLDRTTAELSTRYSYEKLLEEFFAAVQQLIDVYPTATKLSLSLCSEDPACDLADCIHRLPVPAPLRSIDDEVEARTAASTMDLALGNLLVSSHLRVLDVVDRTLSLSVSCLKMALGLPPGPAEPPRYTAPKLRIGSFTVGRDAAAFLQASLLKHLVERLGAEAAELAAAVAAARAPRGEDKESAVFAMQCEVLLERQKMKTAQLQALGEELVRVAQVKKSPPV